jgi:hypothetical protein
MLYGRLDIATITGTTAGIRVEAHSKLYTLFCRSDLARHPEVEDHFAIEVLAKHEGRYLVRELPAHAAHEQAKIAIISWDVEVGPDAKSDLVAECKIAKAAKEKTICIDAIDGRLSFVHSEWLFERQDLEWVLRKNPTTIKYSKRGVLCMTVVRPADGDYEFFFRGRHHPTEVAQKPIEEATKLPEPINRPVAEVEAVIGKLPNSTDSTSADPHTLVKKKCQPPPAQS